MSRAFSHPPLSVRTPRPDGRCRIISGRWRSRLLRFPARPELRPTPNVVRETLFNWLRDALDGARCLDLFAGSGALGFEALSRGAAEVVLVERDRAALRALAHNRTTLGADQAEVVALEVADYLAQPATPFDIVFLDPPYGRQQVAATLSTLATGGWLTANARVYVEAEQQLKALRLPPAWTCLQSRTRGAVGYHLLSAARR